MAKTGTNPVSVPLHDVLKPGTLRGIIRDVGLTIAEFNELLRS